MNESLPPNHRHDNSAKGGRAIHVRDLLAYDEPRFFGPGDFDHVDTSLTRVTGVTGPMLQFTDAADEEAHLVFTWPAFKKFLRLAKLYYYNETASANLNLSFKLSQYREDTIIVSKSVTVATYATISNTARMGIIEVPSSLWEGASFQVGDIVTIAIVREAISGNDTYNRAWNMMGMLIELSKA